VSIFLVDASGERAVRVTVETAEGDMAHPQGAHAARKKTTTR
jgi:hypothetical protein